MTYCYAKVWAKDILNELDEDVILDHCYDNGYIKKPKNYDNKNVTYPRITVDADIDEDDFLDDIDDDLLTDYVIDNNLIDLDVYADQVINKLGEDELFDELICSIKSNNKTVVTKQDLIDYIVDKINFNVK